MKSTSQSAWTRRKVLAAALAAPTLATPASAGLFSDLFKGKGGNEIAPEMVRTLTSKLGATTYNNAYEFGTRKDDPNRHADKLITEGWTVSISGTVSNDGVMDLDSLRGIPFSQLEEREYRMRCVEAWSMVIPWNGIPLGDIIRRLEPLGSAKYVAFTCVEQPGLPGQDSHFSTIDWPYREALTIEEAMHDLTFATFGAYGDESVPTNGMPLKINIPWKYGFKSPKYVTGISFTEEQPFATWHKLARNEYGWYSNVQPELSHPRWSQSSERRIWDQGDIQRIPTELLNGYAEEVGHLYPDMKEDPWKYF